MLDNIPHTHTIENCDKLAATVVDCMDLKDLMKTMRDILSENFQYDKGDFQREWENYEMEE